MANPEQTGPMTQRGALHPDDNDVAVGWNFSNITTQTTTVVKASPGVLHTITFNTPIATTTVVVYNNTAGSGATIASFTIAASPMPVTLTFDIAFSVGLTIVTGVANSDITVTYI
jgi:hypothetical protein